MLIRCCNISGQPEVNSRVQFGTENVTVTLKWAQEAGVSYNVSVVPQVDFEFIHSTAVQLRVAYNVIHTVNIVCTLCGRRTATKFNKLGYGELSIDYCLVLAMSVILSAKCENPLVADNSVRITGYHNPALEGATLTFSCPPGKTLIGPNITTCMENGEWEPNVGIVEVKCAGE